MIVAVGFYLLVVVVSVVSGRYDREHGGYWGFFGSLGFTIVMAALMEKLLP